LPNRFQFLTRFTSDSSFSTRVCQKDIGFATDLLLPNVRESLGKIMWIPLSIFLKEGSLSLERAAQARDELGSFFGEPWDIGLEKDLRKPSKPQQPDI
jgi:hypothetical protein